MDSRGAGIVGRLAASRREVAGALTCVVVGLVLASVIGEFFRVHLGFGNVFGIPKLRDVRMENNLPTWYSAALLACAILSLRVALLEGANRLPRWYILAAVFAYLCADELFKIHERLGTPLGKGAIGAFGITSADLGFRRAWAVYGAALAVVVGLVCIWLFSDLPPRLLRLFVVAGGLYVFGAVALEVFYGRLEFLYGAGDTRALRMLFAAIEEFLEMMGVVITIYALLSYLHPYLNPSPTPGMRGANTE